MHAQWPPLGEKSMHDIRSHNAMQCGDEISIWILNVEWEEMEIDRRFSAVRHHWRTKCASYTRTTKRYRYCRKSIKLLSAMRSFVLSWTNYNTSFTWKEAHMPTNEIQTNWHAFARPDPCACIHWHRPTNFDTFVELFQPTYVTRLQHCTTIRARVYCVPRTPRVRLYVCLRAYEFLHQPIYYSIHLRKAYKKIHQKLKIRLALSDVHILSIGTAGSQMSRTSAYGI